MIVLLRLQAQRVCSDLADSWDSMGGIATETSDVFCSSVQGHQVLEVDTQGDGQGGFDSRMMRWGRCVVVGGMWGLFGKVDKMMLVLVHLTEYR